VAADDEDIAFVWNGKDGAGFTASVVGQRAHPTA